MRTAKTKIRKNTWGAWSEDEVRLLKKLYPDGGAGEIAKRTGRSSTAVRQKAYYMGIKTRENRLWSANEVRLLKKLYKDENVQSIADKLGRPVQATRFRIFKLGLKKRRPAIKSK